jgi:hypothetical protein
VHATQASRTSDARATSSEHNFNFLKKNQLWILAKPKKIPLDLAKPVARLFLKFF